MKNSIVWIAVVVASFSELASGAEKELVAVQDTKNFVQLVQTTEKHTYTAGQEHGSLQKEPVGSQDASNFMCEECPQARKMIDRCCLRFQQASESGRELHHAAKQEYTVACICGLLFVEKLISCGLC